jgi:hypothetical protein
MREAFTVRILVFSDLHTEFWKGPNLPYLPPLPDPESYDVVVAAGDIGVGVRGVDWLINNFDPDVHPIIYVPGNHEYYNNEYHQLNMQLKNLCNGAGINLLNPGVYNLGPYTFVGANMWTDFKLKGHMELDAWQLDGFADFNVIQFNEEKMSKSAMEQINYRELEFVKDAIARS